MGRSLLAVLSIGSAVAWLALSYRPLQFVPANVAFAGGWVDPLFRTLLFASVAIFLLVQFVLLASTFRFPRRISRCGPAEPVNGSSLRPVIGDRGPADIRIHLGAELVWTAIPIVMTVALAVLIRYVR